MEKDSRKVKGRKSKEKKERLCCYFVLNIPASIAIWVIEVRKR